MITAGYLSVDKTLHVKKEINSRILGKPANASVTCRVINFLDASVANRWDYELLFKVFTSVLSVFKYKSPHISKTMHL